MKKMSREQIEIKKERIQQFIDRFNDKNEDIASLRNQSLVFIEDLFGKKSKVYRQYMYVGFPPSDKGKYTEDDVKVFKSILSEAMDILEDLSK
ncbi:MAG: hypothetical protein DKM24_05905 [Candidatus Melainabacteria bacterium]|nr:MAG: hypothetical protein DKM24_05905 [Candidatus Melainabacteria bacterium]